jgi:hypothetical protein
MSSENNDQINNNPVEAEPPISEERKAELIARFKSDVLTKTELYDFKSALSGFLFTEAPHKAIHGVGIGKIDGNGDCARIYYDDRKADDAQSIMLSFAELGDFAVSIPQQQQSDAKPVDLKLTNGLTVQLVSAPQAVLSALGSGSTGVAHEGREYIADSPSSLTETEVQPVPCNATREYTKLPAGTSIWRKPAAKGTIGYFCADKHGIKYVLSCNHVLADFADGTADPDKSALFRDGSGSSTVPLATLTEFVPLSDTGENLVDAALAEISYGIQNRIIEGVSIESKAKKTDDVLNLPVEKHGIATCGTLGVIDDQSCDMRVNGPNGKSYLFMDQIRIVSLDRSKSFAARGDSGSLVFERSRKRAIGLLFAVGNRDLLPSRLDEGADSTIDYALANPIETVIELLSERLSAQLGADHLPLDLIAA